MNSAEIVKQLLRDGWVLRGVKGSHHIYTHPERGGHISVPHPKKDLGIGLVSKLLKQAGLIPQIAKVVKVIKSGELSAKVVLKGIGATAGAKVAIEAAGGSLAE